ncbi:MAG: glycosyltransferase family 39 protein [Caldilineales bacterium]
MASHRVAYRIGGLILLALLLRWAGGMDHALFPDEGSSYFFSRLPVAVISCSLCDPHPPIYYLLLKGIGMLAQREAWLRLPSLLAGGLAVPLTWATAHLLMAEWARWPRRTAWLAAALVAVAPLAVWYSREARPYALLATLTLLLVWSGLRWVQRPGAGRALLYLLVGWSALWTDYGALLGWAGLNLLLLSGWPWQSAAAQAGHGRRWAGLQIILFTPLLLWWLLSAQLTALRHMSYQAIFLAVQAQAVGLPVTPAAAGRIIATALLGAAGLAVLAALLLRHSQRARRLVAHPASTSALLILLLVLALLGAWPRLYTVKRHLNVLLPFVAIAASVALSWTAPRLRLWRVVAGALLMVNLLASGVMLLRAPHSAWREIVSTLRAQTAPGDLILVDELDAPVFAYYWGSALGWQPLRARHLPAATRDTTDAARVWLAGSSTPYRDLHQALPAQWGGGHTAVQRHDWLDAAITLYEVSTPAAPGPPLSQTLRWGLDILSPLDITCPR